MPPMRRFPRLLVLGLAVTGCNAPAYDGFTSHSFGTTTTDSDDGLGAPTTDEGQEIQTVTGTSETSTSDEPSTTGPGETGEAGETTASPPDELPAIVDFEVTPAPPDAISFNGMLDIMVWAEHADRVEMLTHTGDEITLTETQPGVFAGQVPAFTGLENGMRTSVLTPWKATTAGDDVDVHYNIDLPEPGSQRFWETGDSIGGGHVAAMGVLPDKRFVELGTYYVMGVPHCYLRARDTGGGWFQDDFIDILPTDHCTAIDMTIDPISGALHVLVNRKGNDGLRWWVGEISAWGINVKNIATGPLGDTALALARHPEMVAVCGAKKVPTNDLDAFATLIRPNQAAEERLFDYKPGDEPHAFWENARDCTFAGDALVMAGEARGQHNGEDEFRDRLALLEYDVVTAETKWTVAGPGPGVQSRALTVVVDDDGNYQLAGYTCLDVCEPEGDLRTYLPGGELDWQVALGPLGSDWLGPHDIAWHPAGYVVIALGEQQGQAFRFKVQAFTPGEFTPLWTFIPNDMQGFQIAFAVAVGSYGETCAGGLAAGNYPAVACIGS